TKLTSGASCGGWAGAASAPPGARWSATKKPSAIGSECAGRSLKKSAPRAAHHHLHRRKRVERAPPSGAHLGPARTHAGAAVSLQLASAVGDGGDYLVEFLFPALPRHHPRHRGHRFPWPSVAPPAGQAFGGLGRAAAAPGAAGHGVYPRAAGPTRDRVVAGLRPGTQSGGIHLGLLETARTAQLLSSRLRPVKRRCPSRAQADAPATLPADGLLGASRAVSSVTILCNCH